MTTPDVHDTITRRCFCGAFVEVGQHYVFRCRKCGRGYRRHKFGVRKYAKGEADRQYGEWEDYK